MKMSLKSRNTLSMLSVAFFVFSSCSDEMEPVENIQKVQTKSAQTEQILSFFSRDDFQQSLLTLTRNTDGFS